MIMSKMLIYGGQGYVGRNIIKKLQTKHIVYNISPSKKKKNNDLDYYHISGYLWNSLSRIKEISPDYLIIAFFGNPQFNNIDVYRKIERSVIKIDSLLKKPLKFIFLSSQLVYGTRSYKLHRENDPLTPISVYARECVRMEKILLTKITNQSIIIRVPILYGNIDALDDGYKNIVAKFLTNAKNSRTLYIYGTGAQRRTVLNINDLCHLISSIIDKNINGVINASLGEYVSILRLTQLISKRFSSVIVKNVRWPNKSYMKECGHIRMGSHKAKRIIRTHHTIEKYLLKQKI